MATREETRDLIMITTEHYEIKVEDKELHAISVIMEVLDRHLDRRGDAGCAEDVINGHKAMARVISYVASRLENRE
jgi:hypothetical protein